MAKAFINDENLTDIADAIRATLDESRQYLPSEMAAAIDSIPIMAQLNRKKYFQSVPAGAASGYATIEKIEGNTLVWNQLQPAMNNLSKSENGVTFTLTDSGKSITAVVQSAGDSYAYMTPNYVQLISAHKYLVKGCPNGGSASTYSMTNALYTNYGYDYGDGYIFTCDNSHLRFAPDAIIKPNTPDGTYIFRPLIFDLTQMFRAGNEPTTVAEFEAWMAQNIGTLSYYDYNAGELLSCKMQSVKSVGFNQWDEEWELGTLAQGQPSFASTRIRTKNYIPVIGGATYFFKFPWAKFVCSYDDNYNYLGNITITNNIAALDGQVKYLKWSSYTAEAITTYNHDICINLSDPAKNGTYEPYQSDLADIDVTTITGINSATNVRETIFPQGMKQADRAGTVKDILDLRSDTATVNVVSRAYQSGDESDTSVITDGTTTYYALTTPITYTDLQDANGNPLNPRYKVEQGGTEQVLPVNTSTPTTVAPTLSTIYKKNI